MKNFDNETNALLDEFLKMLNEDKFANNYVSNLYESAIYHLKNSGKMLRPRLMFSVNFDLGGDMDGVRSFALALELIHNYSLIHDDLPEMDNDDYRRGQLTLHKKFDQATAVLCGDYLLTKAFEIMTESKHIDSSLVLRAMREIGRNANDFGMLGGQVIDLNNKVFEEDEILKMYEYKTSALFKSSFAVPGILIGLEDDVVDSLRSIGKDFGIYFQIMDDIEDSLKDEKNGKITILSIYTEDKVENYLDKIYDDMINKIKELKLFNTLEFIEDIYGKKTR